MNSEVQDETKQSELDKNLFFFKLSFPSWTNSQKIHVFGFRIVFASPWVTLLFLHVQWWAIEFKLGHRLYSFLPIERKFWMEEYLKTETGNDFQLDWMSNWWWGNLLLEKRRQRKAWMSNEQKTLGKRHGNPSLLSGAHYLPRWRDGEGCWAGWGVQ